VRHIPEHGGDELPVVIVGAVAAVRDLILGSAVDVVEHPSGQAAASDETKVGDVRRGLHAPQVGVTFEGPEARYRPDRSEHTHGMQV